MPPELYLLGLLRLLRFPQASWHLTGLLVVLAVPFGWVPSLGCSFSLAVVPPLALPPLGSLFVVLRFHFGSPFLWLSWVLLGALPIFGAALWPGSSLGFPFPLPPLARGSLFGRFIGLLHPLYYDL